MNDYNAGQITRLCAGGQFIAATGITGAVDAHAQDGHTSEGLNQNGATHKTKATPKDRQWLRTKQAQDNRNSATTPAPNVCLVAGGGAYYCSLGFRRWSSSRATLTSCPISSAAFVPIASTRSSASSDESRGFSLLPSAMRRAISPRMAVMMNPALLSPSCLTDSMPSTTSCGMRAVNDCDFVFLEPVDICNPPNVGVRQNTPKRITKKH